MVVLVELIDFIDVVFPSMRMLFLLDDLLW